MTPLMQDAIASGAGTTLLCAFGRAAIVILRREEAPAATSAPAMPAPARQPLVHAGHRRSLLRWPLLRRHRDSSDDDYVHPLDDGWPGLDDSDDQRSRVEQPQYALTDDETPAGAVVEPEPEPEPEPAPAWWRECAERTDQLLNRAASVLGGPAD